MPENITSVLIIYTGGTIGMVENSKTGSLEPFNFHHLLDKVPELRQLGFSISTVQFEPPIDSSEIEPDSWVKLVHIIADNYDLFDGFVVLHGTDTMAYTASALSFMLENLNKPVILTGSQLPIGMLRTDGKENLITAIEIAAAKNTNGEPLVPEVCIFFGNHLLRGNRTTKISAESFSAFVSTNYPPLAQAGVHIHYDENQIARTTSKPLRPHYLMNTNIVVLKLFPGISEQTVRSILNIRLSKVSRRQFVGGLYDFRRVSCQKVKAFLWRGRDVGFAGKDSAIAALCCAYMLQRVDNNIILRKNDITVFTGKFKNQLFGNNFTGSA